MQSQTEETNHLMSAMAVQHWINEVSCLAEKCRSQQHSNSDRVNMEHKLCLCNTHVIVVGVGFACTKNRSGLTVNMVNISYLLKTFFSPSRTMFIAEYILLYKANGIH